jgi:PAS domain S-box-containing protein
MKNPSNERTPSTTAPTGSDRTLHRSEEFSVINKEDWVLADQAENPQQSEVDYRELFDAQPDAVFLIDNKTGRILQANLAACTLYGYSHAELLTLKNSDLSAEPEETRKITQETPVIPAQVITVASRWHIKKDGTRFPVEIKARFFVHQKRAVHIATIRDISKRNRTEAVIRLHLALIEFSATHSTEEVLQKSLDQVGELTGSPLGFYHFVEKDQKSLSLQAWSTRTMREFCQAEGKGLHYAVSNAGVWADAIRHHKPIVHNNYASLPNRKGLPPGHAQVIRELVVPILRGGDVVAVLGVGNKAVDYSEEDIEIVAYFADLAWEIAERKRAKDALRESEERFRAVVETAPDAIFIQTQQRFAYLNPAAVNLFGAVHAEQLLGKMVVDHFHPDFCAGVSERIRQLNENRQAVPRIAEKILRGDGTVVDVEISAVPFLYQGHHGALVFARNITDRVQAEAERAQFLAQLEAQAQQIRQIMDTVPEGVLLLDADGRVLLANPTGKRDLAILAGVDVGDCITHLGTVPISKILALPANGTWHEIQAGTRTYEAIARPVANGQIHADNDLPEHWVLVINDVTRSRDLNKQLEQQHRLAAVGQLAAGVAHDFNNILAVIALQVPMLSRSPGLTERDLQRLTSIQQQTAYAAQLIQQILDFSRRAVLERHPLDLGAFLAEQVGMLIRTLPATIRVTLDRDPGDYVVLADPTRMQQMVMNLAVNARDAMPKGGTLRLILAHQQTPPRPDLPDGPWVRLTVADSGTGLSPEAQRHLFEPFFTTKPPGQGSGLGLAQVHGIVKQHGGEIEAHSVAGQGATFTIYLPAVVMPKPEGISSSSAPQTPGNGTILIVEDNPPLLDALNDLVEMMGYEVICARNGVEALTILDASGDTIDLVLSDLVMPMMSGDDLLIAMRARGLTLPMVILSGHPLEGELAGLTEKGLAGWLLKPPDVEQLGELLAQTLAERAEL